MKGPGLQQAEVGHRGVDLLAYADRIGGDLPAVRRLLTEGPLQAFSGVHLLPFFVPYDGDDAGFDPIDHGSVDPRLGTWQDLRALADAGVDVTVDLIVNHVSSSSVQFLDWLESGADSQWDGMFLTFDTVFPRGATESEITAFYRPRPGLPFTPYQQVDGRRRLVWTTFMPTQVDLDVEHPAARRYLRNLLTTFAAAGVRTVRLDAVGYAVKTPGTDSFMTEHTLQFTRWITAEAHNRGLEVLVEVHAHHTQQAAIAPLVDLVYDFALPPLLLHSLGTGTVDRLLHWLEIRPSNVVTVLDTHDGIGVIDAGPVPGRPGLIDDDEMASIFARAAQATNGVSASASTQVAWARLPHQVNSTFFSVLGEDEAAYVLARAVQLFLPGRPQVYYVGLLAGTNDVEGWRRTGVGREVNRHRYDDEEVAQALRRDVVRAQLAMVRLRREHPAFSGTFAFSPSSASVTATSGLHLRWEDEQHWVELRAEVIRRAFTIRWTEPDGDVRSASSVAELAREEAPLPDR